MLARGTGRGQGWGPGVTERYQEEERVSLVQLSWNRSYWKLMSAPPQRHRVLGLSSRGI